MAAISIHDGLDAEIVSANPHAAKGLGRYFTGTAGVLLAGTDVAGQLRTPLLVANPGESGLALHWKHPVALGQGGPALMIEAGARAVIGVLNRGGMEVFDATFIGKPVTVAPGSALVSFSIRPSVGLGITPQVGALSFGFAAGTDAEIASFHPFDLTATPQVSVAEAVRTVLESFVVPNTADDLRQMRDLPENAVASVSGHGEIQIGASVNIAAAFNPLASVNTLPRLGKLTVAGAATAIAGVKATLSGDFQIRVQKMKDAKIRLSYHKVAGRQVDISFAAAAGPGVTLGERDLLAMLFDGPGGISGAAREDLVQGGITSEQLDRVVAAMKAGLSRRIELSVAASLSSSRTDDAAFLYEIDLDALDAIGESALDFALAGDLTKLNALEEHTPSHGITTLASRTQDIRAKKIALRINLVGIVNIMSMSELVRTASIAHDEDSGDVVILDKVTSDRVGAITTRRQIRKLLYESTMMSLSYRAIGFDTTAAMDISQTFFFFDRSANRQRVSDYLDAVEALGLDAADARDQLGSQDDFGKASLLLETAYDNAASQRMFGPPAGADAQTFYESLGREALQSLVKPGDPDAYRRGPLVDHGMWKAMKDAGQPNFRHILPPPITGGPDAAIRLGVVGADYSVIVWWASAMAKAAQKLAEMRAFLNTRTPASLEQDPKFASRRDDLSESIAKAIRSNKSSFDDPWGLVALHRAASGATSTAATLISPKLTLFLPE